MREYALVSRNGTVINMCMNYTPEAPTLNDYQKEKGYSWVPVNKVSPNALRTYKYWSERP